jgi:hypothetical protein
MRESARVAFTRIEAFIWARPVLRLSIYASSLVFLTFFFLMRLAV